MLRILRNDSAFLRSIRETEGTLGVCILGLVALLVGTTGVLGWLPAVLGSLSVGWLLYILLMGDAKDFRTVIPISLALGVSMLMLVALGFDLAGSAIGIRQPLAGLYPPAVTGIVIVSLFIGNVRFQRRITYRNWFSLSRFKVLVERKSVVVLAVGTGLAISAAWAAKHVDVYQSPLPSEIVAATTLAYVVMSWLLTRHGENHTILAISLFFSPLALLLTVSQRSDFVVGVDMSYEFGVAQRILTVGTWTPDLLLDPYNSVASLTVLPAWLHSAFGLALMDFLKVFATILFGFVPLILYNTFEPRYGSDVSYWGALLPLGSVAFYELALIARQEIAFIMLAVIIFLWSREKRVANSAMILLLLAGIILSHYTTALILLAALVLAAIILQVARFTPRSKQTTRDNRQSPQLGLILLGIAGFYFWYAISTGAFWANVGIVLRRLTQIGILESSSAYTLSLTLQSSAGALGIFTQVVSFALRAAIVIGALGHVMRTRLRIEWLPAFSLSMGMIAGLVAIIPYLAWQAYTFERLYLQALLILAPFAFYAILAMPEKWRTLHVQRNLRHITIAVIVAYLLLGTGLLPAVLAGDTSNAVQYDLSGSISRRFFTTDDEIAAIQYLKSASATFVYADRYGVMQLAAYGGFVDLQRYISYNGRYPVAEAVASQLYANETPAGGSYVFFRTENLEYGTWRFGPDQVDTISSKQIVANVSAHGALAFVSGEVAVWLIT